MFFIANDGSGTPTLWQGDPDPMPGEPAPVALWQPATNVRDAEVWGLIVSHPLVADYRDVL